MDGPGAWAAVTAGVLVLFPAVTLSWILRARRDERVIGSAIVDMHAALDAEPAPQRSLLSKVADTLAAQDREASSIQVSLREIERSGSGLPRPEVLLSDLLDLPEPQLLLTEFLGKFAGSIDSEAAFASVAARLLQTATLKVFGDLTRRQPAELDRLMLLAADGRISPVALAGTRSDADRDFVAEEAQTLAAVNAHDMNEIAVLLQSAARRQLRLATLLHGQAEAILRARQSERRGMAALIEHIALLLRFPPVTEPAFGAAELSSLAVAFDATGCRPVSEIPLISDASAPPSRPPPPAP